jgi:hypothetical protein
VKEGEETAEMAEDVSESKVRGVALISGPGLRNGGVLRVGVTDEALPAWLKEPPRGYETETSEEDGEGAVGDVVPGLA